MPLAAKGGRDRVHVGVLTPHASPGPEIEFPQMAPDRIVTHVERVAADTSGPLTASKARVLVEPPVLDQGAASLAAAAVDAIAFASTSTSYAIGPSGEAALTARLREQSGAPVVSTCESAVLALRALDVERIALIDPPWFDGETNALGAAYFRDQGLHVVSAASADLSMDASQIEASDVYEWAAHSVGDDVDAVFIGGNGFRSVGAIDPLEAALERPVLTANQVLLWNVLQRVGATFDISRYGRLFAPAQNPSEPGGG